MTPPTGLPRHEPDYKAWSLEKLQEEYYKLQFTHAAQALQLTQAQDKLQTVQAFLDAFKDLGENHERD